MFTTGTIAEVLSGNQNRRSFEFWLVEFEFWAFAAVIFKSPVEKQKLSKTRSLNSLEETVSE